MARIAGNQTADRHPADDYPTDSRWTRALLDNVKLRGEIWEPAAGSGAMVAVLREAGYSVRATDLSTGTDFLISTEHADTIVTNPPYRHLDRFVEKGLKLSDEMLCLLMGWHFVAGGKQRAQRVWLPTPPTKVLAVVSRMRVGDITSQYNHAWVVWDKRVLHTGAELSWVIP
jgi:hypothetical protein